MKNNPVGWFEIYVQDMPRARGFYEQVFQITLEALPGTQHEMWSFPMAAERCGSPGALIKIDGAGLQPHLEAFMWEILRTIQTRVNADGLKLLLGT